MNQTNYKPIGGIYLLPFIVFFLVTGMSLLQQAGVNQSEQNSHQDGSIINQIFLSSSYLMAFVFLCRRRNLFGYLIIHGYPLIALLIFIGLSMMWSMFPSAVFISFVHQSGAVLVAMCAGIMWIEDKDKFFKILLKLVFLYLMLTVMVSHVFPTIGVMPAERWNPGGQWRGLTTHSNTLGMFCLVAVWIASSSFFMIENKGKLINLMGLVNLFLAFYCLYRTNSMTSTLLSTALVFSALSFAFLQSSSGQVKALKIIFLFFIFIILVAAIYIINPDLFSIKSFFRLIGRNENLTGRTSLWELGMAGIAMHPYIGWSFDGLRSFLYKYSLGYGQLHNGYFDLMIRGGIISVFLLLLMMMNILLALVKIRRFDPKVYYFVLAIMVAILIHNITEASFLRNNHMLWLMFLIVYFYCLLRKSVGLAPYAKRLTKSSYVFGVLHSRRRC